MSFKNKLIAVVASAALCASFVPVLAIADLVDEEKSLEPEDVEMVAQGAGIHVQVNGVTATDGGAFTFTNGSAVITCQDARLTSTTLDGAAPGDVITITPTPQEGYTASVIIDGASAPVNAGSTYSYTIPDTKADNDVVIIDVKFSAAGSGDKPGEGDVKPPESKRDVTVTIDKASEPMLSVDKCRFTVGYGDMNDVEYKQNGATVKVDAVTRQKIILGFAITNKYFIPTAIVNGKTYETTDTGTSSDPAVANLCVELTGDDAKVDSFDINLSIGARASVDLRAQSVSRAEATYMAVSGGQALMSDITADVGLSINDAALDTAVPNAVATFDLGTQVDGQAVATVESPLDVTMQLDTSAYPAADYVVVRNHEGTVTELATEYDASTGRIKFTSDQFSDYSLVAKGTPAKEDTKATSKTALAKTGDPLSAAGMAAIALAAFGLVAFATRKVREQK